MIRMIQQFSYIVRHLTTTLSEKNGVRYGFQGIVDLMRDSGGQTSHRRELLAHTQCFFELFLVSDVMKDFSCADDLPVIVFDRRNGQRHSQSLAVLCYSFRLKMFYPLAPSYLSKNHRLITPKLSRNNCGDRLADDLVSLVAQNALSAGVPTGYDSL